MYEIKCSVTTATTIWERSFKPLTATSSRVLMHFESMHKTTSGTYSFLILDTSRDPFVHLNRLVPTPKGKSKVSTTNTNMKKKKQKNPIVFLFKFGVRLFKFYSE